MADEGQFKNFNDVPVYTIKTVVQETGIPPATLRAWERRYGVFSPGRSDGGYRLFSERDIAVLRWLKRQVDSGVSISRAAALLELREQAGEAVRVAPATSAYASKAVALSSSGVHSPAAIGEALLEVLLAFREPESETILSEAFAFYPVDVVVEEIVAPLLTEVGERWHRGEATIAQEHFITDFLRRRLMVLFHAAHQPATGPLAITAAAPAEWHDLGILMVSLALRREGWRVIPLGQNVPVESLVAEIHKLRPNLVCLSATTGESIGALRQVYEAVRDMSEPRPQLVFGGRAFNLHPEWRSDFPGAYLGASAREFVAHIAQRRD